jgi:hypothetical protein
VCYSPWYLIRNGAVDKDGTEKTARSTETSVLMWSDFDEYPTWVADNLVWSEVRGVPVVAYTRQDQMPKCYVCRSGRLCYEATEHYFSEAGETETKVINCI